MHNVAAKNDRNAWRGFDIDFEGLIDFSEDRRRFGVFTGDIEREEYGEEVYDVILKKCEDKTVSLRQICEFRVEFWV